MDGRQKYISELKKLLAPLTVEERTDALDFYNEYIEDAGYNSYQQIVKEMGNPRQLSHKILADYSIKANDEETKSGHTASPHSSWRVFWLIIIAIVTSPITFALSLGALVVLICALAAVFGVSVGILGTLAGRWSASLFRNWGCCCRSDDRNLIYRLWDNNTGDSVILYSVSLLDHSLASTGNCQFS